MTNLRFIAISLFDLCLCSNIYLQAALVDCSCRISEQESRQLFIYFDTDHSEMLSFDEFVTALRGNMSPQREVTLCHLSYIEILY